MNAREIWQWGGGGGVGGGGGGRINEVGLTYEII